MSTGQYVVTFAHPSDPMAASVVGLKRMSYSDATALVAYAAQRNHRDGRILPTCQEDSGSMTDCRPICDAPATHRVTQAASGGYGPYVSLHCKRHADGAAARHYPYSVSVDEL